MVVLQYELDDITVEIVKPQKRLSDEESKKVRAAFIYQMIVMNTRK